MGLELTTATSCVSGVPPPLRILNDELSPLIGAGGGVEDDAGDDGAGRGSRVGIRECRVSYVHPERGFVAAASALERDELYVRTVTASFDITDRKQTERRTRLLATEP